MLTKSSLVNEKQSKEIIHTEQLTSKKEIKSIREQCREILQKPDSEITEEDKAILARYEGAGGLNEENRTSAGVLNEFYTPNNLVEKVWQIVDAYAPDAKTVLEPSAGVGKFANNRPNNVFTMHELDETSARINKILHPDAKVIQGAFQKQFFDDGERFIKIGYEQPKYDVVIGNPPYGTYNDKYKGLGEGREFDRYEEYFIARGLDALKDEKSVMAFVVPSGFLNTATDTQKEIIGSKGILIDAYRLPVGAFPTTDVGTDIIVMKSWTWNESESVSKEEMAKVYADEISNNNWFKKHPEKILGEVKQKTNRFGKVEDVVVVHEGLTVQDELSKIDSLLPKIQVHIEKDNNKTRQSLEVSEKSNNNILRTPKTYPYINDNGSLNPDRLNEGDIIIDKDDGIPYKAHMIFGNQYVRVTSVSMKKENTSLFEELEEKSKSDEHSFELGAGWKDVLNDRFSAPAKEQLENWKYPSWYQKHLDEQEEYESQRDYIRQPVLKILEESKDGKTYNKDELTHIYAETLAKELDFICHHNDIAFEERINPATGEKMKFSTDEYGYARIKHEIPEICDFYGTDLVKSIIYNTAIHFIDETKEDTYLRLQKQYPDFFSEKTENLSILKSIKDISCTEEYVGTKEHGNSIWDLTREYINNVKDKSIDENHNLENVFKHNNLSLSSDAIKITDTAKFLNTELPVIKNKKQKENSSLKNSSVEKSPVMSAEEFSRLYGKDFDEKEFPIWRATNWEGIIDRTKLNFEEENLLHTSQNYVEIEPGQFTHKVLFESGDITAKIESYKNKISFLNQNEDENKIALYQKNIQQLESVSLPKIPIERIHFGVNSTLAEEFTIEHINSEGEIEKLNLQESFILWAKGMTWADATGSGYYWRGGIDYATANISEEDMPQNVSWYDIVEYIDRKSVKADRVSTWRKSDEEINADKAQKRKEAEEKRMARSETADRLFDKYLHEGLSSEISARVEEEYNKRFNSYVIPDYSKLPLFIEGMSREIDGKKFKLYEQQIKGVSFLCNKGNGLLAYDVGVGKTAAGIVATENQIQSSRSKRPVILVPNQVYGKWYKAIRDLFPNVKVNDLYNLNKESTAKYRNAEDPHKLDIPEKSISLMTYEALKNITFTDESCENELFEDYSKLLSEDFEGSARENAQNADKIKGVIGSASQVNNSNYIYFEKCGFDNITVDEAHNFKNLWTVPRPKNKGESNEFSGIPTSRPSARALKLFAMTQLTQRHNDDRNVFLLTATPFTNSPLEVYSMLSYVGRKRLIDSGIYSLRDFCTEFAHTKLELGVNAKGEIAQKQVMKDWKELPALQKILTEFIDKVDGEELKEIIRPKKFTHVQEIEMSDLQKKMMQIDTEKMTEVKEGNSAAVIVSMNAMRVGLVAPALADPARYPGLNLPSMQELVETSPKLKFVCDSVIDMYKNNPEKGQFIYMPLGQTAHGIVKDYLVAHGLPKEAVEIINGSVNNTTDKKAKVTEKFNDPKNKCKILIGGKNTSEGIDLNGNSFVMYNCSLGWNPSETIQAEGRIWRQGNQQGHVHCVYPVMNDSIDSLLYQKHDEKRSRINEIWTYKAGDTLNVEDINPEELKFELIKDPQKRAKLILENGIDTPEYKFTGTKHIQNELNKVNSRIKSFEETDEKRKNLVENLKGAEIKIQNRLKNIEDYKSRELEVPEWCKMELKEERKYKESYEHQLETINRKFSSWGIKDDKDIEEFIPKMNTQKHSLEKELEEKKKELPKILEKEMLKLNEKKILLPSVSEQRKILTEDIEKNLRPMAEVEPEIRTLRFEQMLSQKWEKGEISNEEKDLYSSVGYKRYYDWLDGEIESLSEVGESKINETSISSEIKNTVSVEEIQTVALENNNPSDNQQTEPEEETFLNGGLFSDQTLAELDQINNNIESQKKVHQLITFNNNSGIDEKLEYATLSEAQKEGKKFLSDWELDKSDNGFAVYNKETRQIESTYGYFPVEDAFSKEILLANGYKTYVAKGALSLSEAKVSEIGNTVKQRLEEQNSSKNHIDSHISFTNITKPKVHERAVER
ncbi:MAG: helicase-related protein [Treponema sp.]|nr:helicase-related protein [Treponema sp.]